MKKHIKRGIKLLLIIEIGIVQDIILKGGTNGRNVARYHHYDDYRSIWFMDHDKTL